MKAIPLLKMTVESDFRARRGEMFSTDLGQTCHGMFNDHVSQCYTWTSEKINKAFGENLFISPIFLKLMYKDCIVQTINCGCWLKRNDT